MEELPCAEAGTIAFFAASVRRRLIEDKRARRGYRNSGMMPPKETRWRRNAVSPLDDMGSEAGHISMDIFGRGRSGLELSLLM